MKILKLSVPLLAISLFSCNQDRIITSKMNVDLNGPEPKIVHSSEIALSDVVYLKFHEEYSESVENSVEETKSRGGLSRSGVSSLDEFMDDIHVTSFRRMFPINKFEARKHKYGLHLWYEIRFDSTVKMSEVEKRLKKVEALSVVEFSVPVKCSDDYKMVQYNPSLHSRTGENTSISNDEYSSIQWSLSNKGTLFQNCEIGADINVTPAWEKTNGNKDVVVAVIDQGVQWKHPDLKNNMWVNEAELNGESGVDDDGNGYIDDIYGYDFVYDTGNISPGQHGTHVAGTIAAETNNGIGIAGIAGGTGNGDGVKIMSCPILPADGSGTSGASAKAVVYAADNGAVISQNSWGYENPNVDWIHQVEFSAERDAYQYFIDNAGKDGDKVIGAMSGGLVLFSAGNTGHQYGNILSWPAACSDFISVTSIGADYNPAYYTNYGSWADIIAPGGDMVFVSSEEGYGGILSTCIGSNPDEYTYSFMQGTSMACPHVSGVAALAVSYAKENNYVLSAAELKNALMSGTRNIDNYFTGSKVDDGSYTEVKFNINMQDYKRQMGSGLIDASMALDNLGSVFGKPGNHVKPEIAEDIQFVESLPSALTVKWKVGIDYKSGKIPTYNIYYSTGNIEYNDRNEISGENIYGPIIIRTGDANVGDYITCTINNLQPSTKYHVGVVAVDQWNQYSDISQGVFETAGRQAGKPVLDLQYYNETTTSFSISWIESSDCLNEPYTVYNAFCSDNQDFSNAVKKVVFAKGIGQKRSTSFDNLQPSTKYYVKVIGLDKGDVISEEAQIIVETLSNKAPEISTDSETDFDMQYWESKTITFKVKDPEAEKWTAKLIDDTGLWHIQSTTDAIIVSINGPLSVYGEHTLKIEIEDASGSKTEVQINYNILPNIRPDIIKNFKDYEFNNVDETVTFNLNEYFKDENNEELTYSCEIIGDAAKSVIEGNLISITSVKNGTASINIKATDGKGEFVESTLNVNVKNISSGVSFYPNPVIDVMNIRIGNSGNGEANIKVFNVMGRQVHEERVNIESSIAKINLSSLKPGVYIISVDFNGNVYKGNIIKR